MALNPLPVNGTLISVLSRFKESGVPIEMNKQHSLQELNSSKSNETAISDNIQTAKESSLLYQLISRLLLSPEQSRQRKDSLEKADTGSVIESENSHKLPEIHSELKLSTDMDQFSININIERLQVQEQIFIVNNAAGSFIQQTAVVDALSIRLEVSIVAEATETADPLILDVNGDGRIDPKDVMFNSLLMTRLVDNEQFINELSKTGIQSINLDYKDTAETTFASDSVVQISDYRNSKGQSGVIADLLLQYKSGFNE